MGIPNPQTQPVEWAARAIERAFDSYRYDFQSITRRAKPRFESCDWRGAQEDARERLHVRDELLTTLVSEIRDGLGAKITDKALWVRMKHTYSQLVSRRPDLELAETFFNSVTRRIFATVGIDPQIEFVASKFIPPAPDAETTARIYTTFLRQASTAELITDILRHFSFAVPYHDAEGDAGVAAAAIDGYVLSRGDGLPIEAVDMIRSVFFRNKGAYLVGRIWRGGTPTPFILALLNSEQGIDLDAVLLTQTDASILFSFTRSYFQVEVERPAEVIAFLKSILPQKRTSELYIAIGYNKHGKTELYREILEHLQHTKDLFFPARGDKGMVMLVFTLPSLDMVFKIIRDRFPPPKNMTRRQVMQKYQLVFRQDRAGRLVDAQEFEHLTFERERFDAALLAELESECAETVEITESTVHIRHLYAERRVTPLNLYLRESDALTGRRMVRDYGQAIRDLAATNTFPGDLLLKNFGVTRNERVIFYDYDELALVTECRFREMPQPRTIEEEFSAEPWFYVADNDIFPEEFLPFLGFPDTLKDEFVAGHGEILTAGFWQQMQQRLRAGEIVDIFPYDANRRLQHRWETPETRRRLPRSA